MGGGFVFRPSCGGWKGKKIKEVRYITSRLCRDFFFKQQIMGSPAPVQAEEWMCEEAGHWEASCWESAAAVLALGFCSLEMTELVSG